MAIVDFAYSYFQRPLLLMLFFPLIILAFYLIKKEFIHLKEDPEIKRRKRKLQKIMVFTRALIIFCLLVALAGPYYEHEKVIEGDPFITLLVDNSSSMAVYESVADELAKNLEKKTYVEKASFGSAEKSPVGDAILNNLKPHESILVLSDGNNNDGATLGDVALYAARLNATINAVKLKPIKDDLGVSIIGPSKTMEGAETSFSVLLHGTGALSKAPLLVTIDGETVFNEATGERRIDFEKKLGTGYHQIVAQINIEDYFKQNNVFYKTIKVVPKPRILYYTETESPLNTFANSLYEVSAVSELPQGLNDYYAVIVNDIPADRLNDKTEQLTDFIADGNGMVVLGGENSFDKGNYKDSVFEGIIPVFVGALGKKEGDINIVIVIDISGSTGIAYGEGKAVDVEKALAVGVVKDLRLDNKLAVLAFNTKAYVISEPSYVFEKLNLEQTIARLKDGGGTLISTGILKAVQLLLTLQGSKNIILISDGKTQSDASAIESAKFASNQGIAIYTVGVGPTTNEELMMLIAEITNGIFFRATESSRLKILFGDVDDEREGNQLGIVVLNSNHFITENLEPKAVIYGFNSVVPKSTARLLVTTTTGEPVLSTWRLGLGRVAALTTDDGTSWAGELLNKLNSKLISRIINWAIGDPERKSKEFIEAKDTRINEPTEVTVKSAIPPTAQEATFYKVDEGTYSATIVPQQTGFQSVTGALFAVSYPIEYEGIGFAPEFEEVVQVTGGKIFSKDDINGIVEHTKARSRRVITSKDNLTWPFVLASVIIFLLEIFIRRLVRTE